MWRLNNLQFFSFFSFSLQELLVDCDSFMDSLYSMLYKRCFHIGPNVRSINNNEISFSSSWCISRVSDFSSSSFRWWIWLSINLWACWWYIIIDSTNRFATLYQVQFSMSSECCTETKAWSWTILWLPCISKRYKRWNGTTNMFHYSHQLYNTNWYNFPEKDEHHYGVGGEDILSMQCHESLLIKHIKGLREHSLGLYFTKFMVAITSSNKCY